MPDEKATKDNQILVNGWEKQYGHPLSPSEVDEINCNLSHFFALLLSWEKNFKQKGFINGT